MNLHNIWRFYFSIGRLSAIWIFVIWFVETIKDSFFPISMQSRALSTVSLPDEMLLLFFDKWTSVNVLWFLGWIRKEEMLEIFVFLSLCYSGLKNYTSRDKSTTIFHEHCTLTKGNRKKRWLPLEGSKDFISIVRLVKWLSVSGKFFLFNWIISFRFFLLLTVDG